MQSLPPLDLEAVKRCLKDGCTLQVRGDRVIVSNELGERAGETTADVFDELRDGGFIEYKQPVPYVVRWVRIAEEVASV